MHMVATGKHKNRGEKRGNTNRVNQFTEKEVADERTQSKEEVVMEKQVCMHTKLSYILVNIV